MKLSLSILAPLCAALLLSTAHAGPGAHGPNGEHLDAPASAHAHTDTGPRIEAVTESFELVGQLQDGELSILIDRYDTNEPVLNATLEVEYGEHKTTARFHADHGDYAVEDKAMLAALAQPGQHALLFTLTAGEESDLLEGTLQVGDAAHAGENAAAHAADGHAPVSLTTFAIGGTLLSVVLVAIVIVLIRRDPGRRK